MGALALVLLLVATPTHAQSIYKCTGKDGKVLYSNQACPDDTAKKTIDELYRAAPSRPQQTAPAVQQYTPPAPSPPPNAFADLVPPAPAIVNPFDRFVPDPPKRIWPLEGSYAKCLLDKIPGVANDIAAAQIAQQCMRAYPEKMNTIESGGPFGFDSPGDCIAKMARDTASRIGAQLIGAACVHRYAVK